MVDLDLVSSRPPLTEKKGFMMHILRRQSQQPPPHAHYSSRGAGPYQPTCAPNDRTAGTSRASAPRLPSRWAHTAASLFAVEILDQIDQQ